MTSVKNVLVVLAVAFTAYLAARGLRVDRMTGKLIGTDEKDAATLRQEAVQQETKAGTPQHAIADKLGVAVT